MAITVPTLGNDNNLGNPLPYKDLIITLNNLNDLSLTQATAQILENAANVFTLTTGTDLFTGNPSSEGHSAYLYHGQPPIEEGNTFFATQATLGQTDNLIGAHTDTSMPTDTTDVLYLTTSGASPDVINSFTTSYIPVFDIGANDPAGTYIDMSSASLVHQVIFDNSSGSLTLRERRRR